MNKLKLINEVRNYELTCSYGGDVRRDLGLGWTWGSRHSPRQAPPRRCGRGGRLPAS